MHYDAKSFWNIILQVDGVAKFLTVGRLIASSLQKTFFGAETLVNLKIWKIPKCDIFTAILSRRECVILISNFK